MKAATDGMTIDARFARLLVLLGIAIALFGTVPVAAKDQGAAIDWQDSRFTEQNVDLPAVVDSVNPTDLYAVWFQEVNSFFPASFQIMFHSQ